MVHTFTYLLVTKKSESISWWAVSGVCWSC